MTPDEHDENVKRVNRALDLLKGDEVPVDRAQFEARIPTIMENARKRADEIVLAESRRRRRKLIFAPLAAAAATVVAVGLEMTTVAQPDFARLVQPAELVAFSKAVGLDRDQNEKLDGIAALYSQRFANAKTEKETLGLDASMGKDLEALLKAEQRDRFRDYVKQHIPQR